MDSSKRTLRLREASEDNRKVLEGLSNPPLRRQYVDHLREHEWTVFSPREIDFTHFQELLDTNPELREWIERESDPVLVAERLSRTYPHLFYTIEHVFQIFTDWKIRWTKKRGFDPKWKDETKPIPDNLLEALSDDELRMVARRWLRKEIKGLNCDPKGTLRRVTSEMKSEKSPNRRRLLEYLRGLITSLCEERYPEFVTELVPGKPFPSMHVRLWVRQMEERGSALIVGDVGTQKTSAAVIGLERLGCHSVVVVCRSYAKDMWADEIRRYYRRPMDPYVVQGTRDIELLERMRPGDLQRHRFIIVGYGNIQHGVADGEDGVPEFGDRLVAALKRLKPDAIVIDEAHAIKGDGKRSQRVMRLAHLSTIRHRIMLTATPFENNPNELAHVATLLDPKTFPTEEVFYAICRDNPRIFFGLMTKRMCDYFAQEDVLDLPSTNVTVHGYFPTVTLPCPRDMREVHDAIQDDGEYEATQQVLRMTRFLAIPPVAQEWYPKLRGSKCFRDPSANPKLCYLRKQIAERIKRGKVVIASGIFASGITRKLDPKDEDSYEVAALFERWFPGRVLRLDGSLTNDDRQLVVDRWRNDPEARILIASVPAVSESINLTLAHRKGLVESLTIYYLTLPWKPTQCTQFNGRFRRPGAEVPMEVWTLVLKGTADEALLELNECKWRNFLIGVYGMPILTVEEKALERSTFQRLTCTPNQWLHDAFRYMMGSGEAAIKSFMDKDLRGLPVAKTMAEYYFQSEDHGTPGHISRLLVPTLRRWKEMGVIPGTWEEILDIGSGPLIMERKLNAPVFSIDINPRMIEVGRAHSYHGGRNAVEGVASRMPEEWTDRFSVAVMSLVLDLTSRKAAHKGVSERVRVLNECRRILKPGGLLWCAFQERCFDAESFEAFLNDVTAFGFQTVAPWSNRIEATDHSEHQFAFWSVLLRKRGDVLDKPPCPLFLHERTREGEAKRKQPPKERPRPNSDPVAVLHEQFVIRDSQGVLIPIDQAVKTVKPWGKRHERYQPLTNGARLYPTQTV